MKKINPVIFIFALAALLIIAVSCTIYIGGGSSWTTVFSDDFNRADSTTVGNGWTEASVYNTDAYILNQKLHLAGGTNGAGTPYGATIARPISLSGKFRITIDFTFEDPLCYLRCTLIKSISGPQTYSFTVLNNQLQFSLDGSTTAFQNYIFFDYTHSYTVIYTKEGDSHTIHLRDNNSGNSQDLTTTDSFYSSFIQIQLDGGWFNIAQLDSIIDNIVVEEAL